MPHFGVILYDADRDRRLLCGQFAPTEEDAIAMAQRGEYRGAMPLVFVGKYGDAIKVMEEDNQ